MSRLALCCFGLIASATLAHAQVSPNEPARAGIWIGRDELARLPMSGPAWDRLVNAANAPMIVGEIRNPDDRSNTTVFAKALVAARTGNPELRFEVIEALRKVRGSEYGGRTLELGRKLVSYVLAADLVGLPPEEDASFRIWLRGTLHTPLLGATLVSTHENRPNNWGTHAGASRAAVAVYLGDAAEIQRTAQVFVGWLGDRNAFAEFDFGELDWQADPANPVGVNPINAQRDGHSIDGVLPDDQRRSGGFTWPPPHENYVYEALQGALVTALILHRAGYDTWSWQERALLRAYEWLMSTAQYPAAGDDVWQLPIVDRVYGASFWDGSQPARPGKNVGFTDWTHAPSIRPPQGDDRPPQRISP